MELKWSIKGIKGVRPPWHYDKRKTYGLTGLRIALLKLIDNGTAMRGSAHMDTIKRSKGMRRDVMALRHQFAQGENGVFSDVLPGEEVADIVATEAGDYRDRLYPPLKIKVTIK